MLAVLPILTLALAAAAPPPSLVEQALGAADGAARIRVQPPAGALVGIADANGDELPDIVITASRGRGAWLLPGQGKGTLGALARLDASMGPHGVGDLDGDGITEQLYGGAFGTEAVLVQGKPGAAAAAGLTADLDGDGRTDVVRLEGETLRIVFGDTEREAAFLAVGPDVVSITTADLDRDGALDLVVADAHADQISIFVGDGQGRLRPAGGRPVWVVPFSLAAGDLDGDGAADLVVSDQCGSTVSVLRGNGDGGFSDPMLVTQPSGPEGRGNAGAKESAPILKSLTLTPSTLSRRAGRTAEATVQLSVPAPTGGLEVRLASSDPALVTPEEKITVPAGETSVSFPLAPQATTRSGRLSYLATLTATAGEGSATATLTLAPE
ncbi:MAG TPA: VCBS repeat-containing protein [Candidatus Polarisedimenticolaceae bacterium]|nr:VCBS repeat-containing protein [Candidatus Polarisedimenticolaceae bacterium]